MQLHYSCQCGTSKSKKENAKRKRKVTEAYFVLSSRILLLYLHQNIFLFYLLGPSIKKLLAPKLNNLSSGQILKLLNKTSYNLLTFRTELSLDTCVSIIGCLAISSQSYLLNSLISISHSLAHTFLPVIKYLQMCFCKSFVNKKKMSLKQEFQAL